MSYQKKMKILMTVILVISLIALGLGAYAVDNRMMPETYIAIPLCTFMFVIYVWGQVMREKIKY